MQFPFPECGPNQGFTTKGENAAEMTLSYFRGWVRKGFHGSLWGHSSWEPSHHVP